MDSKKQANNYTTVCIILGLVFAMHKVKNPVIYIADLQDSMCTDHTKGRLQKLDSNKQRKFSF